MSKNKIVFLSIAAVIASSPTAASDRCHSQPWYAIAPFFTVKTDCIEAENDEYLRLHSNYIESEITDSVFRESSVKIAKSLTTLAIEPTRTNLIEMTVLKTPPTESSQLVLRGYKTRSGR